MLVNQTSRALGIANRNVIKCNQGLGCKYHCDSDERKSCKRLLAVKSASQSLKGESE